MGRMKIKTITMGEEHERVLNEIIAMGIADNASQAIRRCIEAVDGYMKTVEEIVKERKLQVELSHLIKYWLDYFISKSRARAIKYGQQSS